MVEGYEGSYEFRFYREDYAKYANFIREGTGWFVYIVGEVVQKMYRNQETKAMVPAGTPRFRVQNMMLLSGVLDKYTSCIAFSLDLKDVTREIPKTICHRRLHSHNK